MALDRDLLSSIKLKMSALVKNDCCCMDLRTSSILIGYLDFMSSSIGLFRAIVVFVYIVRLLQNKYDVSWQDILQAIFFAFNILISFTKFILSVCLLYGLHKYKKGFIRPYLIYNVMFLLFMLIDFAVTTAIRPSAFGIFSYIFVIGLTIYSLIVIRIYWLKMKKRGPPIPPGVLFIAHPVPATAGTLPTDYVISPGFQGYPPPPYSPSAPPYSPSAPPYSPPAVLPSGDPLGP